MSKKRGGKTAIIIIGSIILALVILVVGLLFSSNKPKVDNPTDTPTVNGDFKVAFLMSNTLGDGMNMDIYDGLILSGADTTYVESVVSDNLEASIEQLSAGGVKAILIHGDSTLYNKVDSLAATYGDMTFLLFGTEKTNGGNVSSITYKYEDQGFIQGVLAVSVTDNNSSGNLAEKQDTKTHDLQLGYSIGSDYINPDARSAAYVDGIDGDLNAHIAFFKDTGIGTVVLVGSDAFFQNALTVGGDVFTRVIAGQDVDIAQLPNVMATCIFNVSKDVSERISEISAGTFAPGHYNKGAELLEIKYQDGVGEDVRGKIESLIQEIKNGTLNVKSLGI